MASSPPPSLPVNVFISHAGEDGAVATRIARALEEQRYSTWTYEANSLAGVSYVQQYGEAIDQADVFLVLLSAHSLASHEVTREVEQAHRRNKHLLPILVDVSHKEIQNRQPALETMLGNATTVELRGAEVVPLVKRLVKSLERWGIEPALPGEEDEPADPIPPPPPGIGTWMSDANQIDIADLKYIVFHNRIIDEFLAAGGRKYFLSANKGLGKTLLLTYKRSVLTQECQRSTMYFVPENKPYVDFMSDVPELSAQHEAFLSKLANSKGLWALALRISALSFHPTLLSENEVDQRKALPSQLAVWLKGGKDGKVEPTVVFKEVLLEHSVGKINRLIKEEMNFLEQKFRKIRNATFLFIDKVDQGIQSLSQPAWIYVQAGLIEAAWDAMNANSHVKIYASIRQEAFSNYRSSIKTNLHSATTLIQYSDAELELLLDQLTNFYERSKTFKEFLNLAVVRHPDRPLPECSFQYLKRHTLGRPRDLVIIASAIARQQPNLTETSYRQLVSKTSTEDLVSNIFEEMNVFLDSLEAKTERVRFLSLLPCNILTRREAIRIYWLFNHLDPACAEVFGANDEGMHHPFWELYSAGLLGVVVQDGDSGQAVQRFKQPHDLIDDVPSALPEVEYYLIHPALNELIRKQRTSGTYDVFRYILVGHNCPWKSYYGTLRKLEQAIFTVADAGVRERLHRLLRALTPLLETGNHAAVARLRATSPDLAGLKEILVPCGQEDVHSQLEELLRVAGSEPISEFSGPAALS